MNKTPQHDWEWEISRMACHHMAQRTLALDVSDIQISDELQNRVKHLFGKEKIATHKRSIRRRVIAILIAAALLVLTACMSIPTVREKLYKIVTTYCDEFFSCKSEPIETDEVTRPETEADAGSATEPIPIMFEKRAPTYLPQGYAFYLDNSTNQASRLWYLNESDGSIICYEQNPIGTRTYKINAENAQIQAVLINGKEGIVARKRTTGFVEITLVWNDGIYDYCIDATVTLEETVKIAESIR